MFKLTKQREEGKKNMNEIDASLTMNKISHAALYIGFSYLVFETMIKILEYKYKLKLPHQWIKKAVFSVKKIVYFHS